MKKSPYTLAIMTTLLCVAAMGCLDFGQDEETTTPTESQVSRCRAEMYLNPTVNITPLGFKLEGSGIDDAIWFKFETDADDLAQVFDTSVVDLSKFKEGYSLSELKGVAWWDVGGKNLWGGPVALPHVRYMSVGAEKIEGGYVVYVMWNET
ncbi:MAG: hypothetical protein JW850_12320 [Thermoflexales bacterium]|nr:hypothetical protein [Thermoflexales bacterium]